MVADRLSWAMLRLLLIALGIFSMNRRSFFAGGAVLGAILLSLGCSAAHRGSLTPSLVKSRQWTQRGLLATEAGNWTEAEKLLEKAVDACPDDREARLHYAQSLRKNGHPARALSEMEKLLCGTVEDGPLHIEMAEIYFELGNLDSAARHAEQGLKLDSSSGFAWAISARLATATGKHEKALAAYQRAIGLDPGCRTWLLEIAELYRQQGRPQEALSSLHSLTDTYSLGEVPQQIHYLEGLAYQALKRNEEAIESLPNGPTGRTADGRALLPIGQASDRHGPPRCGPSGAPTGPGHQPTARTDSGPSQPTGNRPHHGPLPFLKGQFPIPASPLYRINAAVSFF